MAAVRYIVKDVEQSVAFYTSLLGFSVAEQFGPAMAIVTRDDLSLWLAGPRASASRPMPDGAQPEPGGWARIVIDTDDIESTASALRDAGATFRNDIISGPGGKQVIVDDPSGNAIEIFQSS
ncbi:MAG: VOC family protein [Chloroflexi bacterium]|nr:VOC family protein [Chloroflexota bacterium]